MLLTDLASVQVKLWGLLKISLGVLTLTMAENATKWDMYAIAGYSWIMLACVGLFFINLGGEVFHEQEFYASMALYCAFAAYFAFSGLTYDEGSGDSTVHDHTD